MMATFMFVMIPRAEVCAERIEEVLDTEPSVVPPTAAVPLASIHGHLEMRDVEFRYPGAEEPVLRGIDLIARARRDDGDHRQHGQRKVDAVCTSCHGCSTPRAARCSSTTSTCAA